VEILDRRRLTRATLSRQMLLEGSPGRHRATSSARWSGCRRTTRICRTSAVVPGRRLATDAGAADPHAVAGQLHLLYDGVGISARVDRDPAASAAAKTAAAALIDNAIPARRRKG
jgi:hypothetical protein